MIAKLQTRRYKSHFFVILALVIGSDSYEKTLRKIVRNQSKMVQKPFSDNSIDFNLRNKTQHISQDYLYPGFTQVKSVIHKMQRPKISTILSSIDTGRSKSMYSRVNIANNENINPYELRMARDAINHAFRQNEDNVLFSDNEIYFVNNQSDYNIKSVQSIPTSKFFPPLEETENNIPNKGISGLITDNSVKQQNNNSFINNILETSDEAIVNETNEIRSVDVVLPQLREVNSESTQNRTECGNEKMSKEKETSVDTPNLSDLSYICKIINVAKVDIDAQQKFSHIDIEPPWMENQHFWNRVYERRYESLMRNSKWPPLKVVLIPRSQVHTIWKRSFESIHNDTVRHIISNIVKKLQFYPNLTFSWNEVSHLSQWWAGARQKSRAAFRRLVGEGRIEITTGMWVETDESTSSLFGIIHQLMEGHQWLQHFLNYYPEVGWLTNSVTHSPTIPYLLSASGISNLIFTNLHYSWQQYFTEYQYTDFIWVQNWDNDKDTKTDLNEVLNRIGNERYPKSSVLTHYLPFNSAGFDACGPEGDICATEFNFVSDSNNLDISTFNVKDKSERLLEQYSKTGTTSIHNVVIAPIGDQFCYESQTEFDYQYNNYEKIAEFVNTNKDIYKTTIEFGTAKKYFETITEKQVSFPTLKGDFLNYADISDGSPAYWTGFFTSRPQLKVLLRRLQSTLRSTEILFSFALNFDIVKAYNASKLLEMLQNARDVVARLQDRNVVSGTLTSKAIRYVHSKILNTANDCWQIQEVAASLLSSKMGQNKTYIEKYVYREGEFISSFKSITHGDQIYIFNSLTHERTEIVELMTRDPNLRVKDHKNNDVTIQINPKWKFNHDNKIEISSNFFKMIIAVTIPPMSLQVFKIKSTIDVLQSTSTIYCTVCEYDGDTKGIPFDLRPVEAGDIIIENYKHRLIFDEYSGFLKTVNEKATNMTNFVVIDFGAFRSSQVHSGMFLFNTNYSKPLEDILSSFRQNLKSKTILITSGQITTEMISIYGNLIQHSVKVFNLANNILSNAIKIETKVDYDVSPKYRDLEIFMSIQTDIGNGSPPEMTIDNNGFQYTTRTINISRRVESNLYPMTSMLYIQDSTRRLTVITDHTQGVTALQEGQIVVLLDRRILFDDGRGSEEPLTDSSTTYHTHYLLLESFKDTFSRSHIKLPSISAFYLANAQNYPLDVFFIEASKANLCHYAFRPLIKTIFPCDVMVINYRAVLNRGTLGKYSSKTALMTLHKQSFSCATDLKIHIGCKGEGHLRLDKMFHNVKAVYQTNLVGTSEGAPVDVLNESNFPAMEITTLRIYF